MGNRTAKFLRILGLILSLVSIGTFIWFFNISRATNPEIKLLILSLGIIINFATIICLLKLSLLKRFQSILFIYLFIVTFYLIVETPLSWISWVAGWDSSCWLFEDSGKTIRFDPIFGYRLEKQPSRYARITKHYLEYVGIQKGNNLGFPDDSQFEPRKDRVGLKRIVVFGDSFTSAQYIAENWPQHSEILLQNQGYQVELMNFSQEGIGLANWWRTLTEVIEKDNYEIDGIIFAVFRGDLKRKFVFATHQNNPHPLSGHLDRWLPTYYPATLAEAKKAMKPLSEAVIVDSSVFDKAIGTTHCPFQVSQKFKPYLMEKVNIQLDLMLHNFNKASVNTVNSNLSYQEASDRQRIIASIKDFLTKKGLSSLVVYIPSREEETNKASSYSPAEFDDTKKFSQILGSSFIDGRELYAKMSKKEIKNSFFPYDGHWNQLGSNHFADYISRQIPNVFSLTKESK
ncbi:SGNH/GDSL hydrolase family protein [Candidatus Daviesbacteria bacterium]|nr:SGNH/GDSL hydrolase family protein [Candidatus Daviesbacteria bacterium]